MGHFFSYMIQVCLVMTLLYLVYKWIMATTTFHSLNRILLLGIYVLSWILPALPVLVKTVSQDSVVEVGLPVLVTLAGDAVYPAERGIDWMRIVLWLYVSGVLLSVLFTLVGIIRMARVIASGRHVAKDNYTEVVTSSAPGPFSWGRYVILRPEDLDESYDMIVAHETMHLRLRHWLDLIPAQLTAILQWFSPAAWLLMRELKVLHEFQVDCAVGGQDPVRYQRMMLKKTAGSSFPVFADSLHHKSLLKKRIIMMNDKKTNPSCRVAVLALPAMAALAVMTLSQPAVADVVSRISSTTLSDVPTDKVTASAEILQTSGKVISIAPAVASETVAAEEARTEVAADNAGDVDKAAETTNSTQTKDKVGLAYFIDGKLFEGSLQDIDPSDIASMTILKDDPAYPLGKVMIETVAAAKAAGHEITYRQHDENGIYLAPSRIAEYKGGSDAFRQYCNDNVKYPADAPALEKPARVIVQFTIGTKGEVSDTKIMRSCGEPFDSEAIRVVQGTSGQWIPAENDGKPVLSRFTIPITFSNK